MAKRKTAKAPAADDLLIELLTEELPPKSLKHLGEAFRDEILNGLIRVQLKQRDRLDVRWFATPRRLAVLIPKVLARAQDRSESRKLMPSSVAFDEHDKPTTALLKRLEKLGVPARAVNRNLERRTESGTEYVYTTVSIPGAVLRDALSGEDGIIGQAVKKLPIAKWMRWGARDAQFVRPVHGLIMLHGSKVIPGEVFGLKSTSRTRGHRFMSQGPITIKRARDYENTLRRRGNVIASFEARREMIVDGLDKAAAKIGKHMSWRLGKELELVDEVTSIVERPSVLSGQFDAAFLEVPRECLIVSMQQHQKYFPVADRQGRLQSRFLFVANMQPRDPRQIVHGNERVLRARLADAKFFYDHDRKTRLAERVPRLAHVVYHNKLGSQLERVERIQVLAAAIALMLNADPVTAERAAYLCKADLLTDMVGEFPELQGIMGRYYAQHDGEAGEVANAIEQHYFPRSAGSELPGGPIAVAVALADKLDTLVGIFGIGMAPTGEKDPFGLRRAAVGVLRILLEGALSLDIGELLERSRGQFLNKTIAASVTRELQDFLYDRLRSYLRDRDYAADEIEAVLALQPTRLDQVVPRLEAIRRFRAEPEGQALAAANKRIQNILRQAGDGDPDKIAPAIDGAWFREDAEKELAAQLALAAERVRPLTASGDYAGALKELSRLRHVVDTFFDKVMVMVDDEKLRAARLQLLAAIRREFREIADVSKLQG